MYRESQYIMTERVERHLSVLNKGCTKLCRNYDVINGGGFYTSAFLQRQQYQHNKGTLKHMSHPETLFRHNEWREV